MGKTPFVFADGEKLGPYTAIGAGSLTFSPDGQRVAYSAQRGNQTFVVLGGHEGTPHDGLVRGGKIIFDSVDRFHYIVGRISGNSLLIQLVEERLSR